MKAIFAGVDIGHSAVKITFDGPSGVERVYFPSYVAPALNIIDEAEAERAKLETVSLGDRSYFVGDTARIQGGDAINSGLLDDWVRMDQHKALVAQACRIITESNPGAPIHLAAGLPVSLFQSQKLELKAQFTHHLPPGSTVTVIPQPLAGYYYVMLERNGTLNPERSVANDSYAVVDIGYYTSDFVTIREGRWVQSGASSAPGVRLALETIMDTLRAAGIECDLLQAETVLTRGRLKHCPPDKQPIVNQSVDKAIRVLADTVYDEFSRIIGRQASWLDGIFVIGGVAEMIAEHLRRSYNNVAVPTDHHVQPFGKTAMAERRMRAPALGGPRYIVSEGLYRVARNHYLIGASKAAA